MKSAAHRPEEEGIRRDPLQAWRLQHTARLLLQNYTTYERHCVAELHAAGFKGLKHLHLNLIRHIDMDGTRMSELAQRSDVTKAAMTALVAQCEKDGYVVVGVDPTDARARLVNFSAKGKKVMECFRRTVNSVEIEMEVTLGKSGYSTFRKALILLHDRLTLRRLKESSSVLSLGKQRQRKAE